MGLGLMLLQEDLRLVLRSPYSPGPPYMSRPCTKSLSCTKSTRSALKVLSLGFHEKAFCTKSLREP